MNSSRAASAPLPMALYQGLGSHWEVVCIVAKSVVWESMAREKLARSSGSMYAKFANSCSSTEWDWLTFFHRVADPSIRAMMCRWNRRAVAAGPIQAPVFRYRRGVAAVGYTSRQACREGGRVVKGPDRGAWGVCPGQVPMVPRSDSLCCGMHQAVGGGGDPIFQKLQRWQTPQPNTTDCVCRHPGNMNTAVSFHGWSCCYSSSSHFRCLSILLKWT